MLLVRQLSYGEQRQLEILLALAHTPKVSSLDEPTAGLSAAETQQVVAMLQHLDPCITVLLIEHDMAVAFQVAEHITVLHQGRLLAERPAAGDSPGSHCGRDLFEECSRRQGDAGGA